MCNAEDDQPLRLGALLREGVARLRAAGTPDAARDARILLRWALDVSAEGLTALGDAPASAVARQRFEAAIARRVDGEPVSHIRGWREFYGRRFHVSRDVLDPRPESEALVVEALARAPKGAFRTLDLGVGSGCLLLSLLAERSEATGLGVDASSMALAIARVNAAELGLSARAAFRAGDWLDGLDERFDVVLCNPPYIGAAALDALAIELRLHEPRAALTPGADALAAYRRIAPALERRLAPGGVALFEVGRGQHVDVMGIFIEYGFNAETALDLGGVPRVVAITGACDEGAERGGARIPLGNRADAM